MPSATPDWVDAPYVRVYLTLANDHPTVWRDPTLLGWWLRCLVAADRYYPAPAPVPPTMPDPVRSALVDRGILVPTDDAEFFRFNGLAALRAAHRSRGQIGGRARAATADRNAGKFAGRNAGDDLLVHAGETRTNGAPVAGDDSLVTGAGGTVAGDQRTSVTTDSLGAGAALRSAPAPAPRKSPPPARAPATQAEPTFGRLLPPDDAECSSPDAHQSSHRYWPGVGWRCLTCQQDAQADQGSFRERVKRHGGPEF